MNSAVKMIKRWQALECELMNDAYGLVIKQFAKEWRVDVKTIRRDLEALRELGQGLVCERNDSGEYCWNYDEDTSPLFAADIPRWDWDVFPYPPQLVKRATH